jgi:cytochrome c-type biogenesis protein CcmH
LSTTLRPLPFLLLLAACGGASSPPPPVPTATPSPAGGDLRPLSSREGATPATPAGAPDAQASLPAGHPPVEGVPSQPPLPAGHPPIGEPVGRSEGSVAGTITLSPKLAVGASDVLYVMAKKGTATLAVRRVEAPSFPFEFEISAGDAMVSGGSFQGPVDVVARLSKTGDAIPARGDLEGVARNVMVPARNVRLTIDTVRQ